MKKSIKHLLAICLCIMCLVTAIPVSATPVQGTQGNELQVLQPSSLEIQLGTKWIGVEFMLRTDAGVYPGTIVVGNDGTLRLEIGGSSSYILSCLQSDVPIPEAIFTQASATQNGLLEPEPDIDIPAEEDKAPMWPLILFGIGILAAIVVLFVIYKYESYRKEQQADEDDDDYE